MYHIPLANCLLAIAVCLFTSRAGHAADWPCFRGPEHNGISSETLEQPWLTKGRPSIKWRYNIGTGFSSVVVVGPHAIAVGNQDQRDTVYCFDAATGSIRWQYSYKAALDDRDFEGGPTATPTIHQDRVYHLSRQGDLFCLKLDTGELQWQQQIVELTNIRVPGWGFGGSPLVLGQRVLLSVGEAGVALSLRDGELLWRSGDKEAGYATPVPFQHDGKTLVMFPSGRSFSAVNPESGETQWEQRWLTTFGCNAADPIVHQGHVLLSSAYNRGSALLKLAPSSVETVWKHKQMQNQLNGCVLLGNALYGPNGDMQSGTNLVCMDFQSGNVHWTNDSIKPAAITATQQHLIVQTTDGDLVVADVTTDEFRPRARIHVLSGRCWTVPTLANGNIYCRSAHGDIVCVSADK